jgi:hypothetical protein
MTFEEDFPSLRGKFDLMRNAYKFKLLLQENCLDKSKVREAIVKIQNKKHQNEGYTLYNEDLGALLSELGLTSEELKDD